jgi:hypothetical protein
MNRFALRITLSNSTLQRQFAFCGASAILHPVFSLIVTLSSILLAAILKWSNQENEFIAMSLLLPLIVIVAPFMNELSGGRKNISLLWLRDAISRRKGLMINLAIIQIMRLSIPMLLWVLVISSGSLLVQNAEKWIRIYFLVVTYFPVCVALSFLCGILNKNDDPLFNQGFIIAHIAAMIVCFFVSILIQSWIVPMVLLSTLLAVVSVIVWTRLDIEISTI